jgi:hypothetical protein
MIQNEQAVVRPRKTSQKFSEWEDTMDSFKVHIEQEAKRKGRLMRITQ